MTTSAKPAKKAPAKKAAPRKSPQMLENANAAEIAQLRAEVGELKATWEQLLGAIKQQMAKQAVESQMGQVRSQLEAEIMNRLNETPGIPGLTGPLDATSP